ncbi:hypothetical protein, partial [Nitrogeniibacter aestuarii]|uniref:hypothetical protein n=1 Tax=Nitrogeniibacter aestuarii TaxID=2815343 RepID=UPI001D116FC7
MILLVLATRRVEEAEGLRYYNRSCWASRIHKRSATLPEMSGQAEILTASISRQEKGSIDESVPSAHPRG